MQIKATLLLPFFLLVYAEEEANKNKLLRLPQDRKLEIPSVNRRLSWDTTTQTKVTAEGDAFYFGASVGISGDTVVIGGRQNSLSPAFIFVRDDNGSWTRQAKLTANDAAPGDYFGHPVAISKDTAIIGGLLNNVSPSQGVAYVFFRDKDNSSSWMQQAKLSVDDSSRLSVAISEDTAVIGNRLDDESRGSAYIFVRNGNTWTEQAKLTARDAAMNDQFGYSVAISGNTAIIGSNEDSHNDHILAGSAYIFVRNNGNWIQEAKLTAIDAANFERFGQSVAISGDTAVIGDRNVGSAYVFVRNNGDWIQNAKLGAGVASSVSPVSISGNTAVIGDWDDDHSGHTQAGSAYIFVLNNGNWVQEAKLTATDADTNDQFGGSVAISGCAAVVGAPLDDAENGSAYIFELENNAPVADAGGPYLVLPNFATTFDGSGSFDTDGNSLSYMWSVESGAFSDSTQESPLYIATTTTTGIYEVTLTVNDGCADSAPEGTVVVVYNPFVDGSVSGDGRFMSPEGAYVSDTTLSGSARFGFNSYYKGNDIIDHSDIPAPDGKTSFRFKDGNLDFRSNGYKWLVLPGDGKAKFEGTGTMKKSGNYGFIVTVVDKDDGDTFRIKIWDKDNGNEVIYDNKWDAIDEYDGTTISSGKIEVGSKK